MNLATFIASTAFFKGLPPSACKRLAERAIMKKFAKGRMLFMEGEPGSSVYILATGMVKLAKTNRDGVESVVRLMGPGEMFGEVILFERDTYPVTAITLAPVEAALIQRADLRAMLGDDSFRNHFIALLFRKQRELAARIQQLTATSMSDRLLDFLRTHFGPGKSFRVDVSKKEIAAALDVTPESFSRLLRQMQDDGILRWEGKNVTIS